MMVFGQPLFLIALTAIAIPVIVHLFNFRRYKKIYFTNVRHIAEITQETKKRNELKHLLILAARILAITALVMAFARPFIPSENSVKKFDSKKYISIFIDNSFSMEALNTTGILLDEAKQKAIEIARASGPSDLFQLLTCDLEGKHQHFVNRDDFIRMVSEVKISPAVTDLGDIMKRQSEMLRQGGRSSTAYLISDFQKNVSDFPSKADTLVMWYFVPVKSVKTANIYIDSVWFNDPSQQPGQNIKLNVSIRNISSESYEKLPLRLFMNGKQKAVGSFAIGAEGQTVTTLPFTNEESGNQSGYVEITDYPVTWDDDFFISYIIRPSIPVLSLNESGENPYLNALFGDDSTFLFRNMNILQPGYSSFGNFSLIILNGVNNYSSGLTQELERFLENGGNIFIIPGDKSDFKSLNEWLSAEGIGNIRQIDTSRLAVSEVNVLSPVFSEVFENKALPENADLPVVKKHFVAAALSKSNTENLMRLQNGDPFLTVTPAGKGNIYVLYSSLDESSGNFPRHSIFVPALYRISILSQKNYPLYYNLAEDKGISLPGDSTGTEEVVKLVKPGSDFGIIPEIRRDGHNTSVFVHGQATEAGNYNIVSGSDIVLPVSFNYDRKESELTYLSDADLENYFETNATGAVFTGSVAVLGKQIREATQGTPLWKYFLVAALFFLLAEVLLVRILRNN